MDVIVLLSCMNQKDFSIIEKSNVQTDVVVVNQCDENKIYEFSFVNKYGKTCNAKFINTTERGLSRSRNMALCNAWGDICLICDDDEFLEDNYSEIIEEVYLTFPNISLAAFMFKIQGNSRPNISKMKKMSLISILRTSSIQITFKRKSIIDNSISFDEKMGSGSGNGGGEEIKFQNDVRKKGLLCILYPKVIVTLNNQENSRWFSGYTVSYFENLGWSTRRSIGPFWGILYLFWFAFSHKSLCVSNLTMFTVIKAMLKGYKSIR